MLILQCCCHCHPKLFAFSSLRRVLIDSPIAFQHFRLSHFFHLNLNSLWLSKSNNSTAHFFELVEWQLSVLALFMVGFNHNITLENVKIKQNTEAHYTENELNSMIRKYIERVILIRPSA